MNKRLARTLSFSFAPALVALACLAVGSAYALEPQDTPAKAETSTTAKAGHAAKATGHAAKGHKHAKHHKKHHKTK